MESANEPGIAQRDFPSAALPEEEVPLVLRASEEPDLVRRAELLGMAAERVAPALRGPVESSHEVSLPPAAANVVEAAMALDEACAPRSEALAELLNRAGSAARKRGELTAAEAYHRRAHSILRAIGPDAIAFSAHGLGKVAYSQGDLVSATALLLDALRIRERQAETTLDLANTLNCLGVLHWQKGDLIRAEAYYRRALEIRKKLAPGSLHVAGSLHNLGIIAHEKGEPAVAKQLFRRSVRIRGRHAPEGLEMAFGLHALGAVAHRLGDLEAARRHYEQALRIRQTLAPSSPDTAATLGAVALVLRELGDPATLHDNLVRAIEIRQELAPGSLVLADSLSDLACVVLARGETARAEGLHNEALSIREEQAPGSLAVAASRHQLGEIAAAQGEWTPARVQLERALVIQERLAPGSLLLAMTLRSIGNVERKTGNLERAEEFLTRAWEIAKGHAEATDGDEARLAFGAHTWPYAAELAACQLAGGNAAQALLTVEESRAQALHRLLAERSITPNLVSPEIWAQYEESRHRQREAARELERAAREETTALGVGRAEGEAAATGEAVTAASHYYTDARAAAEAAWSEVRAAIHQSYPDLVPPCAPPSELLQRLPEGTTVLLYSVGSDDTLLFSLQAGCRPEVVPLGIGGTDLGALCARVIAQVAGKEGGMPSCSSAARRERQTLLRECARRLLPDSVRPALENAARLLICPDGPLWGLPFAALVLNDGGAPEYLGTALPLVYSQSLSLYLRSLEAPNATPAELRSSVVAGDPFVGRPAAERPGIRPPNFRSKGGRDSRARLPKLRKKAAVGEREVLVRDGKEPGPLPHARAEAVDVAALYGATPQLGPDASEPWFRANAERAPLIHLAAHGRFCAVTPMSSGVLLAAPSGNADDTAADGALQAWELIRMRLTAELVVLSACDTARGTQLRGEGLIGLTRAWLVAGARSIVASQWKVEDESTCHVMVQFHRHLRAGAAKDEALQRAMRSAVELYPEPYQWASFILVGDPENHGLSS